MLIVGITAWETAVKAVFATVTSEPLTWTWRVRNYFVDATWIVPSKSMVAVPSIPVFGIVTFSFGSPATLLYVLDREYSVSLSSGSDGTRLDDGIRPPPRSMGSRKQSRENALSWSSVSVATQWSQMRRRTWRDRLENTNKMLGKSLRGAKGKAGKVRWRRRN